MLRSYSFFRTGRASLSRSVHLCHLTMLGMDLGKRESKRTREISPNPDSTSIRRRPTPCRSSSILRNRTIPRRALRGSTPARKPLLWGIARSELYPTVAAAALAGVDREQAYLADRFFRQTIGDFQVVLNLNYTIFDFGARAGRISAAKAEALAANFAFNDTHRSVIYRVEQAYYQLLNASGQEEAARANLSNAQAVQQAAEERLNDGLATLPDVLEARSATAQAGYELQAVLGAEEIAHGNLATALGTVPQTAIRVQPLRGANNSERHRRHCHLCDGSRTGTAPRPPSAGRRRPSGDSQCQGSACSLLSLTEFHGYPNRASRCTGMQQQFPLGTNGRPGGWHGL